MILFRTEICVIREEIRVVKAFHDSHDIEYRQPFGAVRCDQRIVLRLKIVYGYRPQSVYIRLWELESYERKVYMGMVGVEEGKYIFEGEIEAPATPGLLWYYFVIEYPSKTYYYGNNPSGLGGRGILDHYPPHSYQITVYDREFSTPNWFKESIIYHIFVDRFYNGNKDGLIYKCKDGYIIHTDWFDMPNHRPDPETGEVMCNDFFGGNLLGIIHKLPYLKELGIGIIYLSPIFEAFSNHKYDTGDYKRVDPMFGDNEVFRELCCEAGRMGIRVILDGVFSHTGSDSVYFNKYNHYSEVGAYNSVDSPYYRWYRFTEHPYRYDCWWGIKTLPNVDEMEPSYQKFIMENKNSVARYWLNMGAKGWRLDVADELPDEFLKKFRHAVKETDPDAIIIGEVWEDASNKMSYGMKREFIWGKELDGVMNYPLRNLILDFLLGHISSERFNGGIMSLYENYPKEVFYSNMNLIGSHDVARAKTVLAGAPSERGLSRDEQATYTLNERQNIVGTKRLKLASLFQFTFPGVPSIYYGDEAGLTGYRDPFNRQTYPWGYEDKTLIDWYRTIIAIRKGVDALKTGAFVPLYYKKDVYGFMRSIQDETDEFGETKEDGIAIIFLNRSRHRKYSISLDISNLGIGWMIDALEREKIDIREGILNIDIPPLTGNLYIFQKNALFFPGSSVE